MAAASFTGKHFPVFTDNPCHFGAVFCSVCGVNMILNDQDK
jgi:hypothetical protein